MSEFVCPRPRWLFAMLDYAMLSRPMILIPVWLFLLLGGWFGMGQPAPLEWETPLRLLGALVNFTLLLSAVYLQNQIVDRESDRLNRKLFLISEGIVPLGRAKWICALLYIVPVGLSYLWGMEHFLVFVASALLGLAYNTPPLQFKARPVLDVLSNGVGNGVLNMLAGYTAVASPAAMAQFEPQVTIPFALAVGAVFTSTAIPDIEGDRQAGVHGTAVWLGETGAAWLAVALMAGAVVYAWWGNNVIALVGASASLPGFIVAAIVRRRIVHIIAYQWSTLAFALITGWLYAWFVPFLIVIILITKWYYRRRFSLNYPF
jgi:4-hydroxybenzoate polyprenyltransferase